jgi:hypothetical protein
MSSPLSLSAWRHTIDARGFDSQSGSQQAEFVPLAPTSSS